MGSMGGRSPVARDFDLTETAVREWDKQAERDEGTRQNGGLTGAERKESAKLSAAYSRQGSGSLRAQNYNGGIGVTRGDLHVPEVNAGTSMVVTKVWRSI